MDEVRKNEILAVMLFAAGVFIFLSIFTFSDQDLSFYTSDPNAVSQNLTGVIGSCMSALLVFLIGKAAYVIPLLVIVWGISHLLGLKTRKFFFKLFGTFFLLTAVSASFSMINDSARSASFSAGGLVGSVVSGFLLKYIGGMGAAVFIASTVVLSLLIATEFLILPALVWLFNVLRRAPEFVRDYVDEKSDERFMPRLERGKRIAAAREEIAKKLEEMKKQVEEAKKVHPRPARVNEANAAEKPVVVAPKPVLAKAPEARDYKIPSMDFLKRSSSDSAGEKKETLKMKAALLEKTLLEFGVEAKVTAVSSGPVITMYELEPAIGTKVNRITSLSDNISLAMKSTNIRIIAPLPGKGTIGIEVPNEQSELVRLKDVLETEEYLAETSPLKLALGKDIMGRPIVVDLAAMPHLLIAGTTGSGKTVCINSLISSMLLNLTPDELKFVMVDPKRVELMIFEGIPHLVSPIVTTAKKAGATLSWLVGEMDRRYGIFAEKGLRNITAYKEKAKEEKDWEKLPYIVVIIDELADLMAVVQQEVEASIMRLAQLARAAGIHLILATQRPSVNVITGVIKANFPARISFKVVSRVDSKTVLDTGGAEKLLGRGDMLLMQPGESDLIRGQCSLVEDAEMRSMVKFVRSQTGPQYVAEAVENQERKMSPRAAEKDDMYHEAVRIVLMTKQASVSMLQRKLRVGYTRAARMIDIMEEEGIVGPYNGAKPREILVEDAAETEKAGDAR